MVVDCRQAGELQDYYRRQVAPEVPGLMHEEKQVSPGSDLRKQEQMVTNAQKKTLSVFSIPGAHHWRPAG